MEIPRRSRRTTEIGVSPMDKRDEETLNTVTLKVKLVDGYIRQYEDGLIMSREMANATINALMPLNELPEIDSVGNVNPL
jgi:hypothetical protein